ncbi:MAG: hypothetical protein KatS3mg011_2156 [Acidimicrobiia bacterium]|jgi:YidC/Oxa1 family membrane protein insertase|nr:MAG: hypothetical protein KatS3mg011_2156 [Acidimicrobiia bacterium]
MGELFAALERALGTALAFFYDLVPSFGMAIILLTVAINLVLFPLTLRQTRATRAFQEIQPEIKRIQKEYKDDPETMQRELMRVQREAGATPGGCLLPLIVQFPIWLALFRVLNNVSQIASGANGQTFLPEDSALLAAIRSGETTFLGMDLGTPMSSGILAGLPTAIPYALMLVLMVASQYIQQWHATRGRITDQALTDQQRQQQQTQQMLTRIMPLFIGFISWNFPAGLVLYWTTSNVFRLGQQFVIFAIDGRPESPKPPTQAEDRPGEAESPRKRPQAVSQKKRRRRRR